MEATAWCYTGTKEDTNFSFAWTIENFGRKMEIYKNGECLTSDTFKVEVEGVETAWKLECFPNGKQKIGEVGHFAHFPCLTLLDPGGVEWNPPPVRNRELIN